MKEGRPNFLRGGEVTNSAERLNYLVPLLCFNFKSLKDPNSSSLSRFQWILHDSGVLFSDFWNSHTFKKGDLISWGKGTNSVEWLNYSSPLLYFNFKSLKDTNSSSFSRFQCILHDSGILLSDFKNFHKLKKGDQISWGEPILQKGWIIGPLCVFQF